MKPTESILKLANIWWPVTSTKKLYADTSLMLLKQKQYYLVSLGLAYLENVIEKASAQSKCYHLLVMFATGIQRRA